MSVRATRLAILALALAALAAGLAGGLARLGAPAFTATGAAFHGALMVSGFLGTVISLERAIALGSRLALGVPLLAALGACALLADAYRVGVASWIAAPLGLAAISVAIVRRQPQVHTVLLAIAALAWFAGNAMFFLGRVEAASTWWFAFLVLTIAAERLEMTRLVRRPPIAQPLFLGIVAAMLAACAWTWTDAPSGRAAFGFSLVALAAWLGALDIARRTVRREGLPRFAAVALLAGYAWLAVGGLAWALAPHLRDLAVHALALGFVFSMIFAHAPIIVPVVARTAVHFTPWLYLPLGLLHASLAVRVVAGAADASLRLSAGVLNAAAIALFAVIMLLSGRFHLARNVVRPTGASS
jgi:hypothetical protein